MSNLNTLFDDGVELDSELSEHLVELECGLKMLRHPLVTSIYMPQCHASYNSILQNKKMSLKLAFKEKNWSSFVFLHERPFRLDALLRLHNSDVLTGEAASELVVDTFTDAEWPGQNKVVWLELFKRHCHSTVAYWKGGAKLPEDRVLYRGGCDDEQEDYELGISWTSDPEKAEWFAKRNAKFFHGEPRVFSLKVPRDAVLAYIGNRKEEEFIVDPKLADLNTLTVRYVR